MYSWTRGIAAALATLLAGCDGSIGGSGSPSGNGAASGNQANPTSGSGGSGSGSSPDRADPTVCIPGVPHTSQLPRLSGSEYDNTIRDLLGLEGQPSSMLAPDSSGSVDRRAWNGYQVAAESLAEQVMAGSSARARVIPCWDGAACARQFVEEFGRRAFRRPLTTEEVARFEALYTRRAELTATGSFDEAAELMLRAFLLSPSFLTRPELTEKREGSYIALSGYEVASRLSYMLWGSMPDEALFEAAARDALATPEQIRVQAERMLSDPRARGPVVAFHRHWLGMDKGSLWSEIRRQESLYPQFTAAQIPAMARETERLFEHVVFEQSGRFQDLLNDPVAFVNADLAPIYGLNPAEFGSELQRVELDPATRAGIFTRAGFLMSHGLYDRTSPILRGAFIQKELLCTPIAPPPPEAESTPLPSEGLTTNRQRVDAQTADAACASCHHTLINPTGFALEAYDAIGGYQTTEAGVPIDTSATVMIGKTAVEVGGPVDLFQAIASAPEAQSCYARHWVQFAYQRSLTNEDSCTVDNLTTRLTQGGYTVLELIADLTQSDSFRYRVATSEVLP